MKATRGLLLPVLLRMALGTAIGGGITGLVTLTLVKRVYDSAATVVFPLPPEGGSALLPGALATALGRSVVPEGAEFPLATYLSLIRSRRAADLVAETVRLRDYYPKLKSDEVTEFMQRCLSVEMSAVDRSVIVRSLVPGTVQVRRPGEIFNRQPAAERDRKYRELAARVVTEAIRQMGLIADEIKLDRTKANLEVVRLKLADERPRLDRLMGRLTEVQTALGQVKADTYAEELTKAVFGVEDRIQVTRQSLTAAEQARRVREEQVRRQIREANSLPLDLDFLRDSREGYREAAESYRLLSLKYGPENSQVIAARKLVDERRRVLDQELAAVRKGFVADLLASDAQVAALRAELRVQEAQQAGLKRLARAVPADAWRLASLTGEVERQQRLVVRLEAELVEAELAYARKGIRWTVLDEARPPRIKAGPKVMANIFLGGGIGAVLLAWTALWSLGLGIYRQIQTALPTGSADAGAQV